MSTALTYLAPFLVFGLVVFVHELGHFLAAKITGVYAPVFSLGWGGRLFGVRRGETDYRVSWFPIGGYVRMATREDDSMAGIEGGKDRGDFEAAAAPAAPSALWDENSMAPFGPKAVPVNRFVESKSTSARVFIMSSGVMMNILLAIILNIGLSYQYGGRYVPAVVDSVVAGMPAAKAGLARGDEIVAIDGQPVKSWDQVIDHVSPATGALPLTFEVKRGNEKLTRSITPEVSEVTDSATKTKQRVAKVGIKVVANVVVRSDFTFASAISLGVEQTWDKTKLIGSTLRQLAVGETSVSNLGGPIAIARVSVQAAQTGSEFLIGLIAFLSLNIALLNLVPIPVLDGGQILLLLAERIKGTPFSANVREGFARVGVVAVLCLFVLVMFNDVKSWIVG
ncbi:MAG: RIP metalloprotease RseP [Gemmatimonadaceae bacterium]